MKTIKNNVDFPLIPAAFSKAKNMGIFKCCVIAEYIAVVSRMFTVLPNCVL